MSDTQKQQEALKYKDIDEAVDSLAKFGGYDLIESAVDGAQNLNPERKARKQIFLTESHNAAARKELKSKLDLWIDILSSSDDVSEIIQGCEEKATAYDALFTENMGNVLKQTGDLEKAYRSLALFFNNTESDKVKNVNFMNASLEQLQDLDNPKFINEVSEELQDCFDRLDLRENYGMVAVPGYLGSNKVVEKWAKFCHSNKATLVTDFRHLDNPDDVMELFQHENLAGGDIYKSNVVMACNWLVGRKKEEEFNEEEDVLVPPSSALAGKIYKTLM
ncbi:MAG: DUF5458 family protein, partial [Flavobacteriales bacterium]|nr:DUF5458 family protein [Flavobacteriales bacterium]